MSGALLPVPAAAALPGGYAARALGYTSGDPWDGIGLLAGRPLRRELAPLLAPAGWFATAQAPELPARGFGVVPELARALAASGPLVLFRRHPAWRALEGATPDAALAAAATELGSLAGRLARERDLLAAGDLLQTTAAPASPAAARWVRFHVHRLALDPGPLLALLRADRAGAGISPLAGVALGAALGAALAPAWPDAELETALARACLEADGPAGAGTAAAPLALPPFAAPPAAATLVAALRRAAAGQLGNEQPGPATGLALEARLRDAALARAGDLEAAARFARTGPAPEELLVLAVAHALLGLDPAARRRLWRRLAPGASAGTPSLFPELVDLSRLLPSPGRALEPADRAALEARLTELEAEPAALVEPERERARAALAALPAASRAGLERLELWLAAGRPEAVELALAVARRAGAPGEDGRPDAGVVATALSILVDADRAPFPPEATTPPELALLARFHTLRARRGAGAVPEPLLLRLVERTPTGLAPTAVARALDPAAMAALLGQTFTPETALPLLARAVPAVRGTRLLLVRQRSGDGVAAWDALMLEEAKPPREACAWALPSGAPEPALRALLVAAREHPALELPTGLLTDAAEGPMLSGPRLAGPTPGDDPRRGPTLCRLVSELHALGLALATDPRRAARLLPGGGLGLSAIDLRPAFDPVLREAAQARDLAALRALLFRWGVAEPGPDSAGWAEACEAALRQRGPEPPPLADARGEARAFLQDVLPGRGPLTPAAALGLLPPGLAALLDGPGEVAELLRDLREESWAGGEPVVSIDDAGRIQGEVGARVRARSSGTGRPA